MTVQYLRNGTRQSFAGNIDVLWGESLATSVTTSYVRQSGRVGKNELQRVCHPPYLRNGTRQSFVDHADVCAGRKSGDFRYNKPSPAEW